MRFSGSAVSGIFRLLCVISLMVPLLSRGQTTRPKTSPPATKKTTPTKAPPQASPTRKLLTADDVIAMGQAGIGEDLIIAKLRSANQIFDLSTDEMVRLKKAGVSEAVIWVMLDPKAESKAPPATGSVQSPSVVVPSPFYGAVVPPTGTPSGATPAPGTSAAAIAAGANNPDAPHDSGIFWYTETKSGEKKMTALERVSYQGGKTGGIFTSALTLGIKKATWKAVLPGPQASFRVTEARPVFYFYFEEKSAGLGKSYFGVQNISNPNQFALIKLEIKKSNRETIVGEMGAFGASTGTHQKSMIPFKSDRVRPGVYRVVPTTALEPGEYCFLASTFGGALPNTGGAVTAADIFDFSVTPIE